MQTFFIVALGFLAVACAAAWLLAQAAVAAGL
jgi:hypothetical protein